MISGFRRWHDVGQPLPTALWTHEYEVWYSGIEVLRWTECDLGTRLLSRRVAGPKYPAVRAAWWTMEKLLSHEGATPVASAITTFALTVVGAKVVFILVPVVAQHQEGRELHLRGHAFYVVVLNTDAFKKGLCQPVALLLGSVPPCLTHVLQVRSQPF